MVNLLILTKKKKNYHALKNQQTFFRRSVYNEWINTDINLRRLRQLSLKRKFAKQHLLSNHHQQHDKRLKHLLYSEEGFKDELMWKGLKNTL